LCVVKTGKAGAAPLSNAKIGSELGVGDRVRTGGRSSAGLRFADQSLLRVGELSEVVITGARQRQAQVNRGKVFADYKAPGTISGGYAVAAVRGTHVLFEENENEDLVRCYRGRTFVAGKGNDVVAGTVGSITPTTLTD